MELDGEIKKILEAREIFDPEDLFMEDMAARINRIVTEYANEEAIGLLGSSGNTGFIMEHLEKSHHERVIPCGGVDQSRFTKYLLAFGKEDCEELKKDLAGVKFLDLYEELKKLGYLMVYGDKGLVRSQSLDGYVPNLYERLFFERKAYEEERQEEKRKRRLEALIGTFLRIRDFIHVEKNIRLYIREGYDGLHRYEGLWEDLEAFLCQVRDKIRQRKLPDILLLWNDAMGYQNFEETVFIKEYAKESLFFERAYTVTPFTSAALKVMFDKKLQIEDHAYREASFSCEDSLLCKCLAGKGYEIHYWGLKGIGGRLCQGWAEEDDGDFQPSTARYWRLLNCLVNSEKPVFAIVHSFVETHMPWLSPGLDHLSWYASFEDSDYQDEEEQRRKSLQYWDEQFGFYTGFLYYPCTTVVMSDHGSVMDLREHRYIEKNLHICFFVKGNRIPSQTCGRLFSLYQFVELIRYILHPSKENFSLLFDSRDVALFEDADVYNPVIVKAYLDRQLPHFGVAFRGAVGRDDKYVLTGDGQEYYYRLPDEEDNRIMDPLYADRIGELKRFTGQEFIDVENDSKFLYSRQLYQDQHSR